MQGAVTKIQVDEGLVGKTRAHSYFLEVLNRVFIESYCDRLLQQLDIGIPARLHFREIVVSSHGINSKPQGGEY